MKRCAVAARVLTVSVGCALASDAFAQGQTPSAITARVHGTYEDRTGGLGVLYGDLKVLRFEVRGGALVAVGEVTGSLADSAGTPLGRVRDELSFSVGNVASTCNQLQMELAATRADVLNEDVSFEKQTAAFDSRVGTTPKALPVLCAASERLRLKPAAPELAATLNQIVAAIGPAQGQ
jgi:hypothetical protein